MSPQVRESINAMRRRAAAEAEEKKPRLLAPVKPAPDSITRSGGPRTPSAEQARTRRRRARTGGAGSPPFERKIEAQRWSMSRRRGHRHRRRSARAREFTAWGGTARQIWTDGTVRQRSRRCRTLATVPRAPTAVSSQRAASRPATENWPAPSTIRTANYVHMALRGRSTGESSNNPQRAYARRASVPPGGNDDPDHRGGRLAWRGTGVPRPRRSGAPRGASG